LRVICELLAHSLTLSGCCRPAWWWLAKCGLYKLAVSLDLGFVRLSAPTSGAETRSSSSPSRRRWWTVVEIESGQSFYPNKLVIWCHPGLCRHVVYGRTTLTAFWWQQAFFPSTLVAEWWPLWALTCMVVLRSLCCSWPTLPKGRYTSNTTFFSYFVSSGFVLDGGAAGHVRKRRRECGSTGPDCFCNPRNEVLFANCASFVVIFISQMDPYVKCNTITNTRS
jgi:hypothetical protein